MTSAVANYAKIMYEKKIENEVLEEVLKSRPESVLLLVGEGEDLHIRKMNVDGGDVVIEGRINALTYIDKTVKKSGWFGRK